MISLSEHLPGSIFSQEGDITSTQNLLISFKPIICKLNNSHVINFVSDLWFSPGTLVSSTNKTDCHDITEILLKVVLNTQQGLKNPLVRGPGPTICGFGPNIF